MGRLNNTNGAVAVRITFDERIVQKPTANCASCCNALDTGDFDALCNGKWVNGTRPMVDPADTLTFHVPCAKPASVTRVRYTANQPFPQCAVYSSLTAEAALPFDSACTEAICIPEGDTCETASSGSFCCAGLTCSDMDPPSGTTLCKKL